MNKRNIKTIRCPKCLSDFAYEMPKDIIDNDYVKCINCNCNHLINL